GAKPEEAAQTGPRVEHPGRRDRGVPEVGENLTVDVHPDDVHRDVGDARGDVLELEVRIVLAVRTDDVRHRDDGGVGGVAMRPEVPGRRSRLDRGAVPGGQVAARVRVDRGDVDRERRDV